MEAQFKIIMPVIRQILSSRNIPAMKVYERFSEVDAYLTDIAMKSTFLSINRRYIEEFRVDFNYEKQSYRCSITITNAIDNPKTVLKLLNAFKERGTNITAQEDICMSIRDFMGMNRDSMDIDQKVKALQEEIERINKLLYTDIQPKLMYVELNREVNEKVNK